MEEEGEAGRREEDLPFSDEIAAATYRDTSVVVVSGWQIGWFPHGVGGLSALQTQQALLAPKGIVISLRLQTIAEKHRGHCTCLVARPIPKYSNGGLLVHVANLLNTLPHTRASLDDRKAGCAQITTGAAAAVAPAAAA